MADASNPELNRRQFLKAASATGLMLVVELSFERKLHAAPAAAEASRFTANAFVQVTSDNWVIVTCKHHEMGQGATTGIATLVAEELDADWSRVRAEYAPSDATKYNNLAWGPVQGTGGSSAMRAGYEQMRKAGATARAMLVQAAAQSWRVPAAEISVSKNVLSHRSGKKASFGELALAASKLEVPKDVKLKDPSKFTLIGKDSTRRLDSVAKTNGTALYTIDVKLPGLLTAVVLRPPAFGAKLKNFDGSAAKQIKGVTDVVEIPEGVAVVATSMWAALRGRDAVKANWDTGKAQKLSTEQIFADYKKLAQKPGAVAVKSDKTASELARAAKTIEAVYEFPYLAHATMEPMNCVVWLRDGQLETWAGHQVQTLDHMLAAQAAGVRPENVKLNTLFSGGSFGRRANNWADYTVEAVHVAKAIGGKAPVRVQATRESDMRAGLYRPQFVHAVKAGIDASGAIIGWQHRIVGQSIMAGGPQAGMIKNGIDPSSVEGVWPTPYSIPNITVELHSPEQPVRVLWWRSVGHTHTGYVMETMLDELAVLAGRDPVEFRLGLLKDKPRHLAALKLAADKAGWGKPTSPGIARGVAVHESFESVVAQVAEVSLGPNGQPKVHRVIVGVDCGIAINPDVVRAQVEGGVGFALSAALYSEIEIERGQALQSNFHDYRALRIEEMPKVEVHIVPSKAEPTGIGEPGVPPLAPAVANAVYQLTGERVRRLPFVRHKLKAKQV
ncbi:MAG TPA: xanthine dehydrogenase family protein molybdopterin-binding subunit [Polyangiales bacterium]|nr:xanthine dehydrogenase family protein molybdopterin-binding subunit [Polyangiales bacterium]